jgi:outer membrane protein TolC
MKPFFALVALAALAGCATYSPDGGFEAVTTAVKERGLGQDVKWVKTGQDGETLRSAVTRLLADPLTPDGAAQVALWMNRGLQATYADLGIAESHLVQAGRLVNPELAFEHLRQGNIVSIDRTFLFNVLSLLTMPARTDIERRRFEIAQGRVAAETLQVAAETRRAWYSAVAAQESVKYMEQVRIAAEAGAELARRLAAAGNFSKLDEARERAFEADVNAQLARTRHGAVAARERLTRLMGLSGDDIRFSLPARLPDLPPSPRDLPGLEAQAMRLRLDVQGAMKEAEAVAASLGLTRATGFIDVLDVGYRRNSETGAPRQTGYVIDLSLPLFDWGSARVGRSEFTYLQAINRAADTAVRARSEVREAYSAQRTAFDLAKHYRDEVVPLRKRISEENVLRYNGMLISVFELLADARQQIAAVDSYIAALRDFWIADADLELALTGRSPGSMNILAIAASPAAGDARSGH